MSEELEIKMLIDFRLIGVTHYEQEGFWDLLFESPTGEQKEVRFYSYCDDVEIEVSDREIKQQ